jgi:signal transduction histidine kinase
MNGLLFSGAVLGLISVVFGAAGDHFLDLTRIESGSFPLNLKEADFSQVVSRVTSLYETQARAKKIRIDEQFSVTVPVLKFDVDLIERAVGNYLANAIKYSPEGSKIIVRIFQKDKDIVLEVEDNGFGISEEHVHRIFDKFFRITNQTEKQAKGSGLGLAFVKQVMDKHNGTVYVKSAEGKGSTFGFTLPFE